MNVWVCAAPDISSRLRADTQRGSKREKKIIRGRKKKRKRHSFIQSSERTSRQPPADLTAQVRTSA